VTPEGEIVWEYVSPFIGPDRHGDPSNEVFRASAKKIYIVMPTPS
jgi:hypothetical protein